MTKTGLEDNPNPDSRPVKLDLYIKGSEKTNSFIIVNTIKTAALLAI